MVMAKDGEVAHSFQPLMGVSRSFFWGLMEAKWPIRRSRPHASSGIVQDIETVAGQTYKVSFWFSPRPRRDAADNEMAVFWDSLEVTSLTADGTSLSNTEWTYHEFDLTASGAVTRLAFHHTGRSNSYGAYVDAVSVTDKDECTAQTVSKPPHKPNKHKCKNALYLIDNTKNGDGRSIIYRVKLNRKTGKARLKKVTRLPYDRAHIAMGPKCRRLYAIQNGDVRLGYYDQYFGQF